MVKMFVGDIILLIAGVFIVFGCYKKNDSHTLNKEVSGQLKGILAILILFHHLSLSYNNLGLIFPHLSTIGFLCSGCFFALSGYGVSKERVRIGSFAEYVMKRFRSVVIPFLLATVVYIVYYIVFCNDREFLTFPGRFFQGELVKYSWYVFVCIILYLVYGLIYYHDISRKNTVLFVVSLLMMILLWVIYKEKTHWYSSLMCFWFGVIYAQRDEGRFKNAEVGCSQNDKEGTAIGLTINVIVSLILFVVLFATVLLLYLPLTNKDSVGFLLLAILMNLTTIALAAFLFGFFSKWDYHSPIWTFVGKISYEIYLYQGLVMGIVDRLLGEGNAGSNAIIPCVVVLTVVIAVVANKVMRLFIRNILSQKR